MPLHLVSLADWLRPHSAASGQTSPASDQVPDRKQRGARSGSRVTFNEPQGTPASPVERDREDHKECVDCRVLHESGRVLGLPEEHPPQKIGDVQAETETFGTIHGLQIIVEAASELLAELGRRRGFVAGGAGVVIAVAIVVVVGFFFAVIFAGWRLPVGSRGPRFFTFQDLYRFGYDVLRRSIAEKSRPGSVNCFGKTDSSGKSVNSFCCIVCNSSLCNCGGFQSFTGVHERSDQRAANIIVPLRDCFEPSEEERFDFRIREIDDCVFWFIRYIRHGLRRRGLEEGLEGGLDGLMSGVLGSGVG
jgi:hypothetical protein